MTDNCERCCFYEYCVKSGRIETKDCIYGEKSTKAQTKPTIEEFEQALHKADLVLRPSIVFLNPDDAEAVKEAFPRIEEEIVIQSSHYVEKGKGIVMKREDLDLWANFDAHGSR